MICHIYRSIKKDQMYLYVDNKDDFEAVPEQLMSAFGVPEFSMTVDLTNRDKLAQEDINKVKQNLKSQKYHLQMPPPQETLQLKS